MYLHIKLLKNGRQNSITRKSEATNKEVSEHNNFVGLRSGDLFTKRWASVTGRKESKLLMFFNKIGFNLRLAEHKGRGIRAGRQSDKIAQISVDIGEIFLAARSIFRSYLPIFATAGITNGFGNRIISTGRDVSFSWWNTSSN
jgi:hypothetical protein